MMRISRDGLILTGASVVAVVGPSVWLGVRGAAKPKPLGDDDWPQQIDWDAPLTPADARVSRLFFAGYAAVSALALAGGVALGMRTFDTSAALDVLEKSGEKPPTAQAEALAMRTAARALGWGTALSLGSAAAAVLGARYGLGFETPSDFGAAADVALQPVARAMQVQGEWVHAKAGALERWGRAFGQWIGAPAHGDEVGPASDVGTPRSS